MADFQNIAQQFVTYYYQTFDSNREGLAPLYRDNSMLTFESNAVQGGTGIILKLKELPFQKVEHQISTVDAQPQTDGGILVLVTGALLTDGESRPMSYSQVFTLKQEDNTWFVQNDIFKLVYPAA